MSVQGLLQAINTEHRLHAVANPPAEHPARVPVDDRHQIREAMCQPDVPQGDFLRGVGDIRAPDLVGTDYRDTEQVRIYLVFCVWPAGVRPWRHAGQPHLPHQALYPLTIDAMAHALEKYHHLAATVERTPRVLLVDQATEQQIIFVDQPGLLVRIDRGTRYPGQNALPDHADRIRLVDPRLSHHGRLIPDFF